MKTVEIAEATRSLATCTSEVDDGTLVVPVDGRAVAALVAVEDADLESIAVSTNPTFIEIIERSRERQKREGGISSEEMRRRLGLARPHV